MSYDKLSLTSYYMGKLTFVDLWFLKVIIYLKTNSWSHNFIDEIVTRTLRQNQLMVS
jgi:hypothetical protein